MAAGRQLDEHRLQVARVVLDPQLAGATVHQVGQRAILVEYAEQADAVAPDDPLLEGQEVEQQRRRVGRHTHLPPGRPLRPGRGRRLAQRRMHLVVVGAEHLQHQDALELPERQHRRRLGVVVAARRHVGRGGAGQRMHTAHQGSHQPLDVPPEVRRRRRAVVDADAVLLAAALERLGVELAAIVHMDHLRQAVHRPGEVDVVRAEPVRLRQHRLRDRQRRRRGARGVERQVEAQHRAGMDVQRQRQPGAADAGAGHVIHQHEVHLGVVDLDHLQRPLRPQAATDLAELVAGRGGALAGLDALAQAAGRHPRPERLHRRHGQPGGAAVRLQVPPDHLEGRALPLEVHLLDGCLHLLLGCHVETPRAPDLTRLAGQQRGRDRVGAEGAQQAVDARFAQAQGGRCCQSCGQANTGLGGQRAEDRLALDGFGPIGVGDRQQGRLGLHLSRHARHPGCWLAI